MKDVEGVEGMVMEMMMVHVGMRVRMEAVQIVQKERGDPEYEIDDVLHEDLDRGTRGHCLAGIRGGRGRIFFTPRIPPSPVVRCRCRPIICC